MQPEIKKIAPEDFEPQSFQIIEEKLGVHDFSEEEFAIVRRVIHATGDFSFAENIRFHPDAIAVGCAAIRAGKSILVDEPMAAAGISRRLLEPHGGQVFCRLAAPGIAELAKKRKKTRSEVAIEQAMLDDVGIVVVGNAPSALVKVVDMIKRRQAKPDLIIGVPVGFVNAAESKELLVTQKYPFITSLGYKGGTSVAVAMVNALLRMA